MDFQSLGTFGVLLHWLAVAIGNHLIPIAWSPLGKHLAVDTMRLPWQA